jgi:hypothetical protein
MIDPDEVEAALAPRRKVRTERRSQPVLRDWSATDLAIATITVVAGVGGALADPQPTGIPTIDLALRTTFAAGLAFVTPRARRWTWLVLSGAALAASGLTSQAVPAAVALAVALLATLDVRRRWLGAIVGGASAWSLLRLPELGGHGTTALIAAAAVIPVLVSAYRRERRRVRRRIRWGLAGLVGFVVVAVGLLGVAALGSADDLDRGVTEARAGIDAAKAGDEVATDRHLQAASDAFADANGRLGSWMTWPARAVPVVAQQADALVTMSGLGRDLAVLARDTTDQADYRGITLDGGGVDVAQIAALAAPLDEIEVGLRDATQRAGTVSRDWLAPPLQQRFDELQVEIDETSEEVAFASDAVAVAPGLLGADGPRRYFIAFTTPAEARGLGGFMGNWAVLEADQGRLELSRSGRIADLLPQQGEPPRTLDAPADYVDRYGSLHPESFPGDVTFSPDFPSVAQAIASIYEQVPGGAPIDGALAIDPYGLAAMLEITGPIAIEGRPEPLTAANAADYLLREQYVDFDTKEERIDVLDEASRTTFEAFIRSGNLRPSRLADVLGPAVAERHIVANSSNPAEQALLERIGMAGAFPVVPGEDFFGLVTQNAGNNKIDVYLHRAVDYRVSFDPSSGAIDANATVTLRNDAPSSGLPDYVIANRETSGQPPGTNWMWFNFYSPHELVSLDLDGEPLAVGTKREFGLNVYQAYLPVPSGGEAIVALHLTGTVEPSSTYRLGWYQQPLTNPDEVEVSLAVAPPWYVDDPAAPVGAIPVIPTGPVVQETSRRNGSLEVPLRLVVP